MTSITGLDTLREDYEEFNESILTFLPKKSEEVDDMGIPIYSAGNTRPLNITNTDNRILANAVRLKIEPLISPEISEVQRGFIAGRSMLANVVDVDCGMQHTSLNFEHGLGIFPDFAAAFPSVDHDFIHEFLESLDWPDWLTRFVKGLYTDNKCCISVGGRRSKGFALEAGIRQGCPLSPFLFAVVADLLLCRLQRLLPAAIIRAYADDIALVLSDGAPCLKLLEINFREYALLSGLYIHHGKTVLVPLAPQDVDYTKRLVAAEAPSWSDMSIKFSTEYLGFSLGPDCADKAWDKACKKYLDRARTWGSIGAGLFHTLAAYRTYVLPVLSFVAQLAGVPSNWERLEQNACKLLFPGPRCWISANALRGLKHIGFTTQLPDLHSLAAAAKCRVARYEDIAHGGLHITSRLQALRYDRTHGNFSLRSIVWYRWYNEGFLANLADARGKLRAKVGTEGNLLGRMRGDISDPDNVRRQWQKTCRSVLESPSAVHVVRHLRRRLDRWAMPLLPGHRVQRAIACMKCAATSCPPRVCAALLRTWCNGWVTARRMQRVGQCVLGCPGEDSIEHYARCRIFNDFGASKLQLEGGNQMECFLCLHKEPPAIRKRRALALYSLYKLHGSIRHGAPRPNCPANALWQIVRDTMGGNSEAFGLLT